MAHTNLVNVTTIVPGNIGWHLQDSTGVLFTVQSDVVIKINTMTLANVHATADTTASIHVAGMGSGPNGTNYIADGSSAYEGDADNYLLKNVNIPAGTSITMNGPWYLMESDEFKGFASTSDQIDLFVSYEVLTDE